MITSAVIRWLFIIRFPSSKWALFGVLPLKLHYDIPLTSICYYFLNQVYASLNLLYVLEEYLIFLILKIHQCIHLIIWNICNFLKPFFPRGWPCLNLCRCSRYLGFSLLHRTTCVSWRHAYHGMLTFTVYVPERPVSSLGTRLASFPKTGNPYKNQDVSFQIQSGDTDGGHRYGCILLVSASNWTN